MFKRWREQARRQHEEERERFMQRMNEYYRSIEEARKEDERRRFAASQRIFAHGFIPLAFLPNVTTEMLEGFAGELDERASLKG